jgi:hypothetical protein
MVQRQGWAFDKALLESISISTEGKRVATRRGVHMQEHSRRSSPAYPVRGLAEYNDR